jgi:FAD/FMN-containing dehydrogenase
MPSIEILKKDGALTHLAENEVQKLENCLQGQLIRPGDGNYDSARKVWNGLIDRRPALIASCAGTADVVAAVNFAREHELLLSIRSGGHNVSGAAIAEQGMVIDLSRLRGVKVDEHHHIAKVEAGALLGDVDRETQKYSLATPLGVVSQTGVAGLTLHGGLGWQVRKHGLSMDNLAAVEMVTANGRVLRASAQENDDLFWAVQGGGGNFGVVTSFEFHLHQLGPEVWICAPIYPLAKAREVMTFCRDYMAQAPEDLMVIGVYWTAPAIQAVPAQHYGQPVIILLGCYTGPAEQGLDAIQPLCSITEPIADLSAQMSWLEAQQFLDQDYPEGGLYYWKSIYLQRFDEDVIAALAAHTKKRPSRESSIDVWFLGGAIGRVADIETPYYKRDATTMVAVEANWQKHEDTEANIAWARAVFDDMQRFSDGSSYLNFPGFTEDADKLVKASYGPNLAKLRRIKAKYDPDNVFQGLLNITPQG